MDFQFPRISIVTPSFNQVNTIEETIQSVLSQGYPNLEYMIIDGGSTDGSVEIIRRFENALSYWVSEKDNGQSHAINKGWQRATGGLLSWLNSDDILAPGALMRLAELFNQYQDSHLGLIYAKAHVINPQGEIISTLGETFELAFSLQNLVDVMPQPSVFVTRESLTKTGFLDESLHYSMDFDLYLRNAILYTPVFVDEIWSYVRYTPQTKTSQNPLGFINDHFIMIEKLDRSPVYAQKCKPFLSAARASNYLRSARLQREIGKPKTAFLDFLKAVLANPIFTMSKITRVTRRGRYRTI